MYPPTQQPSPASTPNASTPTDPRVEAFGEFLAALDRTESVLTPMRRLRRLGFSVCVVRPQATQIHQDHRLTGVASVHRGPLDDGATRNPRPDRPPLLNLDVAGHPAPCQSWGDEDDADTASMRRHALDDWVTAVARSALGAVGAGNLLRPGSTFPKSGPVHVDLTFVSRPRQEEPPGLPWTCAVRPNGTKADPTIPDLDGLARATLGALAGIILADVSQVASIAARKVYGPSPGASIAIYPA